MTRQHHHFSPADILRYLTVADLVILTVPGRAPVYVVETTERRASA